MLYQQVIFSLKGDQIRSAIDSFPFHWMIIGIRNEKGEKVKIQEVKTTLLSSKNTDQFTKFPVRGLKIVQIGGLG
jgi:hypothetical protein